MRPVHVLLVVGILAAPGCLDPTGPSDDDGDGGGPVVIPDLQLDADRIWANAEAQVQDADGDARYRTPGTAGNRDVADWISSELNASGATSHIQFFRDDYRCESDLLMQNVDGVLPGATNATIFIAAHFDTRPVADKDPDPARRGEPVLGANDGASGVAIALELARLLGTVEDRSYTYRFLFFDGEDGGYGGPADTTACGGGWALGSRHHAGTLTDEEVADARAFILLDLVGDKDLELRREGYSRNGPGEDIQTRLWTIGGALGHAALFVNATATAVIDDHVAYLERGIPAVDIIHLDGGGDPFPSTHHTTFDDLAHLSKANMAAVGNVVLTWVLEQERDARAG